MLWHQRSKLYTNFRNHWKLNASIFLSASPGELLLSKQLRQKMSFLHVKIMLLFYIIISQYGTSIWLASVPKMMCTYFPQIDRKGLSNVLDCFSLLKPVKVKFLRYFSLRFLLIQSCTYGTGWCFVCATKILSTCFFQITNLKNWKYFVLSGPLLANKVTLKPWNYYLFALLRLAS